MKASRGFKGFLVGVVSIWIAWFFLFPMVQQILIGRRGAHIARAHAELGGVRVASQVYFREYGVWPQSLDELTNNTRNLLFIQWYRGKPIDPWGHAYQYSPFDEKRGWGAVLTLGRDGKPGGEGQNADIEVRFGKGLKEGPHTGA